MSRYLRLYLIACVGLAFGYLVVHVGEPLRLNVGDAWRDASAVMWIERHGIGVGAVQLAALRLGALVASGLSVWLLYQYARRMWTPTVGLIAAALTSTSLVWMLFADSLHGSPIRHAACFLALWGVVRALEDGLRRHYLAVLIGTFVCLVLGPDDWLILPLGVVFTVYVKRGAPFARGNWYTLAWCAAGALVAYWLRSAPSADWQSTLDSRVPTTVAVMLRRDAMLLTPMVWVTLAWTVWRALRAASVKTAIEDGTTWLLVATVLFAVLAPARAESATLRVQSLLPLYAIGSALLIARWLEAGKLARVLASAWCVLAPLWAAWLVASHPREVLDRGDVAKANEYLAHNDANSFVISNLLADGPIHAAFGRHAWPRFLDRDATSPHRMIELLGDTGTDYIHAVIFTTPGSRFVDRSISQLMHGTTVDGWPYLIRAKVNRRIQAYDQTVLKTLEALGATRVLRLHNFDIYRIERAPVIEMFGRSLPVTHKIDFDSVDAIRNQLLGWGDQPDAKETRATPSGVRGFTECFNPIAMSTTPRPSRCNVTVGPKGIVPIDVGWISAAELLVRVDRVCDHQLTFTLRAPAPVGISLNDKIVLGCADPQWGTASLSMRIPSRDIRPGLNIIRISDQQGEPKPGQVTKYAELQLVTIEPLCETPP